MRRPVRILDFSNATGTGDWSSDVCFPIYCLTAVNDCVDLTPQVREDILLEFPWHPLCDPECRGLPRTSIGKSGNSSSTGNSGMDLSAWAKLNRLKL